jgi:hypothetical protein
MNAPGCEQNVVTALRLEVPRRARRWGKGRLRTGASQHRLMRVDKWPCRAFATTKTPNARSVLEKIRPEANITIFQRIVFGRALSTGRARRAAIYFMAVV